MNINFVNFAPFRQPYYMGREERRVQGLDYIFRRPRGWAFSAISFPAWWGICLRAIKTNTHLYPRVGEVGFYFDWCISLYFGL